MPSLVDAFVLPRASLVITAACLGTGLALLVSNRPPLGSLKWPVVAAAAAALIAFAFSVSWPLSFVGAYTRYESMPMRLAYLGLLAVPVWLLRADRSRLGVVAAFVLGTAVACGEAVWQQVTHVPFRPDGNVGNAGLLGALVAIALPLAIGHGLRGGRWMAAWWLSVPVLVAGLVVSTSRAGGLGALAGCLALVVFRLRGRRAALVGVAAVAGVMLALLLVLISPLRFLNGDPGPTRIHLWADGLHLVAARPLTGWGEDTTGLVLGRFLSGHWAAPDVTFDRVHSGILDLAATQGLLGVAALAWVLVVGARGAWRQRWHGSVGPLAAACLGFSVWVLFNFDWAPATGAFWLLTGTAWSAVCAADEQGNVAVGGALRPAGERPPYARRAMGAVGLALAAAVLGAMPILAEAWYAQGRPDLAVRVDPLQSQYHRALGEQLLARGSDPDGLQQLRLAAGLGATDPGLYVELGDEEMRVGDVARARADYQMALTIDPYWAPAKERLATSGGFATA